MFGYCNDNNAAADVIHSSCHNSSSILLDAHTVDASVQNRKNASHRAVFVKRSRNFSPFLQKRDYLYLL